MKLFSSLLSVGGWAESPGKASPDRGRAPGIGNAHGLFQTRAMSMRSRGNLQTESADDIVGETLECFRSKPSYQHSIHTLIVKKIKADY